MQQFTIVWRKEEVELVQALQREGIDGVRAHKDFHLSSVAVRVAQFTGGLFAEQDGHRLPFTVPSLLWSRFRPSQLDGLATGSAVTDSLRVARQRALLHRVQRTVLSNTVNSLQAVALYYCQGKV